MRIPATALARSATSRGCKRSLLKLRGERGGEDGATAISRACARAYDAHWNRGY